MILTSGHEMNEFQAGMPFLGGRPWLDLVNTTPLVDGEPDDLIATPEGLSLWLTAAGLPAPVDHAAEEDLRGLRQELASMLELLREELPLPQPFIDAINARLAKSSRRLRIEMGGDSLKLVETFDPGEAGPAGTVAEDFARFIAEHEARRLKHCANPACNMVFYDMGKNNRRRWCSMSVCGNRHKVARFRSRARESKAG